MTRLNLGCLLASCLVLGACEGSMLLSGEEQLQIERNGPGPGGAENNVTDPNQKPPPEHITGSTFTCNQGELPGVSPLKRLAIVQYSNTLGDLFGNDVVGAASASLMSMPVDGGEEGFKGMDLRLSQRHINSYYGVASDVAAAVVAQPARLETIAGSCASQTPLPQDCFASFVTTFGQKVYRRPLSETERSRMLELDDGSREGAELFRSAIFTFLMSPQFLYHTELDGAVVEGDHVGLSDFELASRLSYHFWQSMPDDELLRAAADGELATEQGYQAQVDRLFNHPRTQEVLLDFFRDWYNLEGFGGFANSPAFQNFAAGDVEVADSQRLYQAMVEEVDELVRYHVWGRDGSYGDLLTEPISTTDDNQLASLYDVETWDGTGEPPRFPEGQRAGLLTRAAFLVTGEHKTSPIHRGVHIRREILCDHLPTPDPNNLPAGALDEPEVSPDATTRQRFEAKTAPGECAGCHSLINPIGFALENYDAIGRYRTEERVINDAGEELAVLAVNAATDEANIDGEGAVNGPIELSATIAASPKADACLVRHYFRFSYRRYETLDDGCILESLRDQLQDEGGSMRAMLRAVAMHPEFKRRRIQ